MGYGIVEYKWREVDLQGHTLAAVGVQKKERANNVDKVGWVE